MKQSNNTCLINGIATEYLHVDDRLIHYGDGIFETILCGNSKLFYWLQHYQRLQNSALRLDIKCPDENLLLSDIRRLFESKKYSDDEYCVIKIILSRGTGERGYHYSDKIMSKRIVMLSSLSSDYSSLCSSHLLSGDLYLCKIQVSINKSLAGLKHLNRLENVLARNEWSNNVKKQYIDGLMLNANKRVIECTTSNIFAIRNETLFTPELSQSGVHGIIRDQVFEIAAGHGLEISETTINIEQLMTMDEMFITNSLIGIKSVSTFNDKHYEEPQITKRIFEKLLTTQDEYAQKI